MGTTSKLGPVSSVAISLQNDNARTTVVQSSTLPEGQWMKNLQPTGGQEISPGQTGCWVSFTTKVSGLISGSLQLTVAQAGDLELIWCLDLDAPFNAVLSKSNWTATDVDAQKYVNPCDYAHVWVQLIVVTMTVLTTCETLRSVAERFNVDWAYLAQLNGVPKETMLKAGQSIMIAQPPIQSKPSPCRCPS